ncbi:MAG: polysaccharide chain length determinant protein (PEP-CTERM system associated) [Paraglaciecola sp.]|jgi:polysaccharide chain length determinant protein (PEP-CTERM system associated)
MLGIQQALDQVLNYVRGVWVKKRYIIISSWLICPIGWSYVASMPDVYESSARVYVDTTSLLRPLLRGLAVYNNRSEQVSLVARTLLSRPNLEKIARTADLDITVETAEEMETLIDELKANIKLSSTAEQNIYTISYPSYSPELSQKIVQITLDDFVETSLGSNRQGSDSAEQFIQTQIEEYEQRLVQAEKRLVDFKISRMDRAPGTIGDYYSQFQRENTLLQDTELKLLELSSQLAAAQAQLSGEAPVFGLTSSLAGPDNQSGISTKYDTRIAALESRLDELLIQYTQKHPEVRRSNSLLEKLKAQRNEDIQSMSRLAETTGSFSQFGNVNQNPVYQEMKLAVASYENQIAALTIRADDSRAEVAKLTQMMDLVPQIEAESKGLNRDYNAIQQQYLGLISRREQAEMSRKAGANTSDVQFRVIDPPVLPSKPSGPARIIFYTVILFMGFASGIVVAFLISQVKPIALSASQLKATFGIPIFGTVSDIDASVIRKVDRGRMIVFILSSLFIVGIYASLVWIDISYGRLPFNTFGRLL